jgi:hypothetical protein
MRNALLAGLALFLTAAVAVDGQTRRNKRPAPAPAPIATPTPADPAPKKGTLPEKRNGRPVTGGQEPTENAAAYVPAYFYEFSRPGFTYSRILIEHDKAGKGKISFQRDGSDELLTDPLQLTPAMLTSINDALAKLDFLNSTETYQTGRDYSTMGNVTFTLKEGSRSRTAKYNWSENKFAKALMDEYRRIGNEYTWRFDFGVARENQPLMTPGLLDQMDSYLARGEISDPPHILPMLSEIAVDERLPLITRNHAEKLIKRINKAQK